MILFDQSMNTLETIKAWILETKVLNATWPLFMEPEKRGEFYLFMWSQQKAPEICRSGGSFLIIWISNFSNEGLGFRVAMPDIDDNNQTKV